METKARIGGVDQAQFRHQQHAGVHVVGVRRRRQRPGAFHSSSVPGSRSRTLSAWPFQCVGAVGKAQPVGDGAGARQAGPAHRRAEWVWMRARPRYSQMPASGFSASSAHCRASLLDQPEQRLAAGMRAGAGRRTSAPRTGSRCHRRHAGSGPPRHCRSAPGHDFRKPFRSGAIHSVRSALGTMP